MGIAVEKKFVVDVAYNGVTRPVEVQPEEQVTALLARAIAVFGITQGPHLLSLYREDGTQVPENESAERAGLQPGEVLLLRPNAVKGGGGNPLRLSSDILAKTFETLAACGGGRCECAVYWTGPSTEDVIDGLEHPVHLRSRFGYEIQSEWLTRLWRDLARDSRSVKAQVHTHPGEAFHSATDDRWPIVSQPGFLSIVIPDFARGIPTLDRAWLGQLLADGTWQEAASIEEALAFA